MGESIPSRERPGTGHPFSSEEISEFDARFTEHEMSGIDFDPQGEVLADE